MSPLLSPRHSSSRSVSCCRRRPQKIGAAVATTMAFDPLSSLVFGIGLFDESLHEGLLGYVAAAALLGVTLCGLVIVARAKGAKPPPEPAPVPAHA